MKYRREIDGLRAVAVLPVILFHAGFKPFAGGFVGVDVFFVISGYLITTIILSDMNHGKFSIVTFYERRARRILPALFFVMFCCLPFAWLWLAPNHLDEFCQSLAAVSLFSSNILFLQESGYFATAAELKPLLHTWSLAVEEQYYVLFPLFLMALWKLRKRWIFSSLMLVAVISLAGAQYGAYNSPADAFFLLPTRCWELAIGALVAFYFLYKKEQEEFIRSHKVLSEVFGYLGFGLILYSIFVFDEATPFPSFYALIPTIGTALIIVFTTQQTAVGRFLGTRVMVGIGLLSYSTYLWHQPLFVFARHKSATELNIELLLVLSVLSIVLAYFSWRFVEVPFRNKEAFSKKKVFVFAVVGSVFFAAVGLAGHLQGGFPDRFGFPDNLLTSFKRSSPVDGCFDKDKLHEVDDWYCHLGDKDSDLSFVVFGDSHILSLYDAFNSAAADLDLGGAFVGASGCPPFLGIHSLRRDQSNRNCHELNERVLRYVIDNEIKDVFLAARWTYYTDGSYSGDDFSYVGLNKTTTKTKDNSRKAFVHGFNETVEEYKKNGVALHLISQVPQQEIEPVHAYQRAYMFESDSRAEVLKNISVTLESHRKLNAYVNGVFAQNSYPEVLNFEDLLCEDHHCPVGTDDTSYYFDDDHLSISGAERLIPSLRRVLDQNLKQ